MASRILGMGDMLSLIERAEQQLDEKKAAELERKLRKNKFDLNDLLDPCSCCSPTPFWVLWPVPF